MTVYSKKMDDSLSDIYQNSSHEFNHGESATENQIAAEQENNRLHEVNDQLSKENNMLRAQFERVVTLSKEIDGMHKRNSQLESKLRTTIQDKEDLAQRLDICTRKNEELVQKAREEQKAYSDQRKTDVLSTEKEISRLKESYEAQLNDLYNQLQLVQNRKEQADIELKLLRTQNEKLLKSSSSYFPEKISSVDALISILSEPPKPAPPPEILNRNSNEQIDSLKRKIKKGKSQFKALANQYEELESEYLQYKKSSSSTASQKDQEIHDLQNKLKSLQDEKIENTNEMTKQIQDLTNQVSKLKNDLAAAKKSQKPQIQVIQERPQVIHHVAPPQPVVQPPPQQKSQALEFRFEVDQLTEKNQALSKQLSASNQTIQELNNKFKETEQVMENLRQQTQKAQNEYNALQVVHQETVKEIDSIRKSLHTKETAQQKKEKTIERRELKQQRAQISVLTKTVESQKQEIYETNVQNESKQRQIDQQNSEINHLQSKISEMTQESDSLKDEIHSLRSEIASKPDLKPEDLLPSSCWRCSDFDQELCKIVDRIGANNLMHPQSKLQNAFKEICKYFHKLIADRDVALNEAYKNEQAIETIVHQFSVNASIALGIKPITYEEFLNNSNILLNHIKNKVEALEADERRIAEFVQNCERFAEIFGTNSIDEAKQDLDSIKSQLASKTKKLKASRNKFAEYSQVAQKDIEELTNTSEQLNNNLTKTTKMLQDSQELSAKLKKELQSTKNELQDALTHAEEREAQLLEEHEKEMNELSSIKQSIESELNSKLQTINDDLLQAKNDNEEKDALISALRKALSSQKQTITEQKQEIDQLTQNWQEEVADLNKKYTNDKTQLIESYEKAVAEITAQCDMHRGDVQKISLELANEVKKNQKAKEFILNLRKEKAKLENEMKLLVEKTDREIKLTQTSAKAHVLANESKLNTQIAELKTKMQNSQRKLYAFIADTFRQYYSAQDGLDDKNVRMIISKAKSDIDRLQNIDASIRRLIGADGNQTTDDAVAQLFMHK